MITNGLGFSILGIAILAALETHDAIVNICNIFSQEEFLIRFCFKNYRKSYIIIKEGENNVS